MRGIVVAEGLRRCHPDIEYVRIDIPAAYFSAATKSS
jgi:hypothetical protein